MKNIAFLLSSILALSCFSCGSDSSSGSCTGDFDQTAMFANMADNVIIPALAASQASIAHLKDEITAFRTDKTEERLAAVQSAFRTAYLGFQTVEYFQFGPAETALLNEKLNNFPANAPLLNANVAAGNYNLDNAGNYYSGFPALDYLLFGLGVPDTDVLSVYNGESGDAYAQYLQDVVDLMDAKITEAATGWNGYRDAFTQNTGTAAGTSVSLLLNSLNEQFENARRNKIGVPAGFDELNAATLPTHVEAYHSGMSKELLAASMEAAENYFNGGNGLGLDDYLMATKAMKEGMGLHQFIQNGFAGISAKIDAIPGNLSDAISDDLQAVQEAYVPIANQVVPMKTDAASALCVSITYVDSPSDTD